MKRSDHLSNLLKVAILITLTLNLVFMFWQPAEAEQNQYGYSKRDNSAVLKLARDYEAHGDWVNAFAYYSIYLDRAPKDAVEDTSFWGEVTRHWEQTKKIAIFEQDFAMNIHGLIEKGVIKKEVFVQPGERPIGLVPPSPVPDVLGPAPDEILVYVDNNFGGDWTSLPIGNYYNAGQMHMPDNSLSSAKVGTKVRAYFCDNNDLTGKCQFFISVPKTHHPILAQTIGNDIVSSIRVERDKSCANGPDEVTIFMHANYDAPCQVLQIGDYYNSGAFNLPNDSISSIKIGYNVQLILCEHHNFGGICETFTVNDSYLGDNSIGNDRVSSIRIEKKP